MPGKVAGEIELLAALVALVFPVRVRLVDQNVRVQATAVLEDLPAELANLFPVVPVDVLVVELEVSFVEELPVALRAGDGIQQLLLRVFLLLVGRIVERVLLHR